MKKESRQKLKKIAVLTTVAISTMSLVGCGTFTGIPAHGGGKRFSEEQRIVSASARSTIEKIDVSALYGRKVAVVYDFISDEGGGTLSGGRTNLIGSALSAYTMSPVTSTVGQFQVFNLTDRTTSYGNNTNASSSTGQAFSTNVVNSTGLSNSTGQGTNSSSGTQNSSSTGTNSSTGTSSSTGQNVSNGSSSSSTNASGTNASQNIITGSSTGSNSSTSVATGSTNSTTTNGTTTETTNGGGSTTTNNSGSNSQNTSSTNNGTGSFNNTSATTGSNSNTTNSTASGSNTQNGTSSTTGTASNNTTGTSSNTSATNSSGTQNGSGSQNNTANGTAAGTNSQTTIVDRQVLSTDPASTERSTNGNGQKYSAELQYKGMGEYTNFAVPKSDASYFMGLVRNYLLLSGVEVTVPTDKSADTLLYVTVDVFGTNRSRFDAYVLNKETLKAETAIEMMAFDKSGRLIMRPQSSNDIAKYEEVYLFWAGPFYVAETVKTGTGLLKDWSGVRELAKKRLDARRQGHGKVDPIEKTEQQGNIDAPRQVLE